MEKLDRYDRILLRTLQARGRASNVELSEQVNPHPIPLDDGRPTAAAGQHVRLVALAYQLAREGCVSNPDPSAVRPCDAGIGARNQANPHQGTVPARRRLWPRALTKPSIE